MKAQYKWALAAAAVLLLGFVSLQQTGALWRSDANNGDGGTITAGVLNISAGDEGVKEFDLGALALDDADPLDSVQKALPVINSGDVRMSYKLNSVSVTGDVPLLLRAAVVPNEAACTPTGDVGVQLYSGAADTGYFTARTVQAGATEVLCLRMTVAQNAPRGKSSAATFTFGAESVPHS
ncbi:hypothetical protein [Gordonia phthalatica]|uniref:Uncharacterized protein n=1 Tax=Gordonia phthalatica TaxID=1136941 RepID=A0A0N9NDD0_9ACTN|nr:hypothetical protein [Gordonia phthalatica]ALG85705.1 hypothetical protein ACH46_15980 [Gordonia phthalatica]